MERQALLQSIATTAADYRTSELAPPTPDHVDRWVRQFDGDVQVPLLCELDHVLKQTYFSKNVAVEFLSGLIENNRLVGDDPSIFWKRSHILNIQRHGHSQEEFIEIFEDALEAKLGFGLEQCGNGGDDFIYIDDAVFSGSRMYSDLSEWIKTDAPQSAKVHVVTMALHTGSEWNYRVRLKDVVGKSGKTISFQPWRVMEIENQKANKYNSEVLWPCELPAHPLVEQYLGVPTKYPFEPRIAGGNLGPFSSEEGRQLLEREFVVAGLKIRSFCQNPKDIMKPLGFSQFGLGFGSTIVTFRNCPNNSPLALWWGDPNASPSHPFSKWYPLFPRKTYE